MLVAELLALCGIDVSHECGAVAVISCHEVSIIFISGTFVVSVRNAARFLVCYTLVYWRCCDCGRSSELYSDLRFEVTGEICAVCKVSCISWYRCVPLRCGCFWRFSVSVRSVAHSRLFIPRLLEML